MLLRSCGNFHAWLLISAHRHDTRDPIRKDRCSRSLMTPKRMQEAFGAIEHHRIAVVAVLPAGLIPRFGKIDLLGKLSRNNRLIHLEEEQWLHNRLAGRPGNLDNGSAARVPAPNLSPALADHTHIARCIS